MSKQWNEIVHRRRRRTVRMPRWLVSAASLAAAVVIVALCASVLTGLSAASRSAALTPERASAEVSALRRELEDVRGRLELSQLRLDRMNSVAKYSSLYDVPADLAGAIYDISLAEGLHPSLGFQLVKVESGFKSGAKSQKNAIGYTQILLRTARAYDSTLSERDLQDRDTNLRLGFRFLRGLLRQFDGDLNNALVAYNRGPGRVTDMIGRGEDPANGYAEAVLKGVVRKGAVIKGS
jgi:soluble lytic murein transglycosylase-like protein